VEGQSVNQSLDSSFPHHRPEPVPAIPAIPDRSQDICRATAERNFAPVLGLELFPGWISVYNRNDVIRAALRTFDGALFHRLIFRGLFGPFGFTRLFIVRGKILFSVIPSLQGRYDPQFDRR
jgi:hypothetical protein